jgi:hypothetical protein
MRIGGKRHKAFIEIRHCKEDSATAAREALYAEVEKNAQLGSDYAHHKLKALTIFHHWMAMTNR